VTTEGASSAGIRAESSGGVAVTSGSVTTHGDDSTGIHAQSNYADADVTSTGAVATSGADSHGIFADGVVVTVTSNIVTTTGAGSTGIFAHADGLGGGGGSDALPASMAAGGDLIAAALGPDGGVSVTSGSVTTTGPDSPGIEADADTGDAEVASTGTVATSGADSAGILANADAGAVSVDANAVTAAGAGSNAIDVTSATTAGVTIRGLVQSSQAFALQADGGAATVAVVAGGTLRGRIDLTDNGDTVNNSGTFETIGASEFGAGADLLSNAAGAMVRSVNGAAVLAGLETFNNSGLVEMRDGAVGDSLNVSGAYQGQAGSALGLDVDFTAGTADRLIVGGGATGSTVINMQASGSQFSFNPAGILVVDAGAGTQESAFTLAGAVSNAYIGTSLRFDPAAFNFLIVSGPNQPVFETVKVGEIVSSLWYKSADAVDAQLQSSRDGSGDAPGNALRGESGAGIWVQAMTGETDREAVQSFTIGGTAASFDLGYEEEFQGLQGGVELGAGPLRFGVTGGFGDGDAVFDVTGDRIEFDVKNIGAYAQLRSGGLWANGLVKMDWIDLNTQPGPGLSAKFDARSFGAMLNLGYRAELGLFFVEPSAGIAWVKTDVDSYQSGGATVDFDDAESLRAQAGLRFGAALGVGESATLTPYVGIRAFDELRDGNTNRFTLGATFPLADDSPGTHGRAEAGFSLRTGSLEAFVRGELDFAGDTDGKSIRGGIQLRF
jgi:outer membrane autotransporter protein